MNHIQVPQGLPGASVISRPALPGQASHSSTHPALRFGLEQGFGRWGCSPGTYHKEGQLPLLPPPDSLVLESKDSLAGVRVCLPTDEFVLWVAVPSDLLLQSLRRGAGTQQPDGPRAVSC